MTTFVNVRSNCYFNALMQALLSCKHFNEWAKKQKGAVIDEYLKILNNPKPQSTNIPILNAMQRVLRTGDKHMQRFGFSQECADEGLKFFINCVGAESQFATRYDSHIVCRVCKSKSDPKKDINIFVNVADCDLFLGKVEEGKINKYLLSHTTIIDYYDCGVCKERVPYCFLRYTLKYISPVLVVVLDKYKKKVQKNMPMSLVFPGEKLMKYELVAQIEHFGNSQSGHYIAICDRDGNVMRYNDTSARPAKLGATPNTYIMFYQLT